MEHIFRQAESWAKEYEENSAHLNIREPIPVAYVNGFRNGFRIGQETIDLSKYTQMDLRDLRVKVDEAISKYADRDKTKVYGVFMPFIGWKYYIDQNNALEELKSSLEDPDDLFQEDVEYKTKAHFLTEAELEYCQDYNQYKEKNG